MVKKKMSNKYFFDSNSFYMHTMLSNKLSTTTKSNSNQKERKPNCSHQYTSIEYVSIKRVHGFYMKIVNRAKKKTPKSPSLQTHEDETEHGENETKKRPLIVKTIMTTTTTENIIEGRERGRSFDFREDLFFSEIAIFLSDKLHVFFSFRSCKLNINSWVWSIWILFCFFFLLSLLSFHLES